MEAESLKTEPKRKRRWFQFSLRTLLVATTAIAVACGWLGSKIERKRRERQAVAAFRSRSGESAVWYDYQIGPTGHGIPGATPSGPGWLQQLLGDDFFNDVIGLTFIGDSNLTDADLARIKDLPALQSLNLRQTKTTDAGLADLKGLSHVRFVRLDFTNVTDAGLANLAGMESLEQLAVEGCQITDAGLTHLRRLTNLDTLILSGTQVTDAGLLSLNGLTSLNDLVLEDTKVTDAGVKDLQKSLPNCRIVH